MIKNTKFSVINKIATDKRNNAIMFVIIHITLIVILLALSSVRRAFLALIMNIFILVSLVTGLYSFSRLDFVNIKRFIIFLSVLLIISLITMFLEAFLLSEKHYRYQIFMLNAPIIIDIIFVVVYICYLK
jgi:hypothetical protein